MLDERMTPSENGLLAATALLARAVGSDHGGVRELVDELLAGDHSSEAVQHLAHLGARYLTLSAIFSATPIDDVFGELAEEVAEAVLNFDSEEAM
jgi:hypothetical protein